MIRMLLGMTEDNLVSFGEKGVAQAALGGALQDTLVDVQEAKDDEAGFAHCCKAGANLAEWLTLLSSMPEVSRCCCFDGPEDQGKQLHIYLEPEERYPGDFDDATMGFGKRTAFRYYLRRFIRYFRPIRLLKDKNYWLCLDHDGKFSLRLGKKGQEIPHLSETENWIFHYVVFLQLVLFWDGAQAKKRHFFYKKPLLIRDFSPRIDESIDFDRLMSMAEQTGHQVILYR